MTTPRPVALVTGAARRIGAAIATALHAAGYDLALHFHRSASEASALQDALEARRRHSTALLQADLSDTARLPSLVERTVVRFGRLDALVNNASAFFPTPIGESTEAMWDALMGANAKAPFFLSQAAAFYLRESRGAILNLSDVYAERPRERHAVYCMSKAALSMMTLALARELAPEVRVNAIAPGRSQARSGDDPELRAGHRPHRARRTGTVAKSPTAVFSPTPATPPVRCCADGGRWLESESAPRPAPPARSAPRAPTADRRGRAWSACGPQRASVLPDRIDELRASIASGSKRRRAARPGAAGAAHRTPAPRNPNHIEVREGRAARRGGGILQRAKSCIGWLSAVSAPPRR